MRTLLNQLELIFTVAGIGVILLVTLVVHPQDMTTWQVAAITATAVGLIHGVLFWLVRRRQREVRRETIAELQGMLKDIINNQLAVIAAMNDLREIRPEEAKRACDYTARSVTTITEALHHLSEESLRSWHAKHAHS
jgi:uncharacterized membrane protein (UPF0182 family)